MALFQNSKQFNINFVVKRWKSKNFKIIYIFLNFLGGVAFYWDNYFNYFTMYSIWPFLSAAVAAAAAALLLLFPLLLLVLLLLLLLLLYLLLGLLLLQWAAYSCSFCCGLR